MSVATVQHHASKCNKTVHLRHENATEKCQMEDASGKIDGAYRKLAALSRLKEVKARMEDPKDCRAFAGLHTAKFDSPIFNAPVFCFLISCAPRKATFGPQ